MKLSIIIPVLNEGRVLPALFDRLQPLARQGVDVIVVDGGSDDGSSVIAELYGYPVVQAPRGRASQMNAGAAAATGDTLLFLHADTFLPDNGLTLIQRALSHPKVGWGRFDVRIQGTPWMLRVVACLMNWRSRWSGIATGDQAMFVRRELFERIGGFPVQALMEDIALSRRLLAFSRPACLRTPVQTSGRRWESRGVWPTIFLMWRLRWAYWRGVSPDILAKEYR